MQTRLVSIEVAPEQHQQASPLAAAMTCWSTLLSFGLGKLGIYHLKGTFAGILWFSGVGRVLLAVLSMDFDHLDCCKLQ
jgi:hypothetical protein